MFTSERDHDSEFITIPELSGAYGQARVTFTNVPFQRSRSTNRLCYPDADFGPMLMDEIFHKQPFFTRPKGVFKKIHVCRNCETPMDISAPVQDMFEVAITYKQFTPFVLRIEVPAAQCLSCSTPNAISSKDVEHDIPEAMIQAFESQHISP